MYKIDRAVTNSLDVHVVPQLPDAQDARREGVAPQASALQMHFMPTSASCLNLAEITRKRIRGDTFVTIADLEAAIADDLLRNHSCGPNGRRPP